MIIYISFDVRRTLSRYIVPAQINGPNITERIITTHLIKSCLMQNAIAGEQKQDQFKLCHFKTIVSIPSSFLLDTQNHSGLETQVPNYQVAKKELELGVSLNNKQIIKSVDAVILYGLLHRRYLQTKDGEDALKRAVISNRYGHCLRNGCNSVALIPCGISETHGAKPMCTYCISCRQYYAYKGDDVVDGCFFSQEITQKLADDESFTSGLRKDAANKDESFKCGKTLFGFEILYDKLVQEMDKKKR